MINRNVLRRGSFWGLVMVLLALVVLVYLWLGTVTREENAGPGDGLGNRTPVTGKEGSRGP